MFDSTQLEVESISFTNTVITVTGLAKEGDVKRSFTLKGKDAPHPDLNAEREKVALTVAVVLELDEETQKKCRIDKLKYNRETGEYDITMALLIPGMAPPPKITINKCNDLTAYDGKGLLDEAAMYISGEKTAQLAFEY